MRVQSGVEAMDISGDSGDSEEKKTLVRLCKTGKLWQTIVQCSRRDNLGMFPYFSIKHLL